MNFLEMIILNGIYTMFPMLVYLFYFSCVKNLDKMTKSVVLDFCLLTSFYFLIRFGEYNNFNMMILLINIPLLVAYLVNSKLSIFALSFLIISKNISVILYLSVLEYFIYYLLYFKVYKKNRRAFIVLFIACKSILNVLYNFNILDYFIFIDIFMFILITILILLLLKKGWDIINLRMTLNDLKKEEQVRTSLFKITHEIKNPIAVCKGYLDMFDVNNKEHSKKYIPIIRSEINRTLLLLQDFLDCNHLKLNKDILDINMLLEDVSNSCMPLIRDKNINYILDISSEEVYIDGDYERLKQVIINIIKNSIEAINLKEESYIKVTTKNDSNYFHIYIEDNGLGIKKEDLEKIVQPFFSTKKNGTGLGVTLSMEIIKAHEGKIIYDSKYGSWTKVEVILPINI